MNKLAHDQLKHTYTFTHTDQDGRTITHTIEAYTLRQIRTELSFFLRGCGFVLEDDEV